MILNLIHRKERIDRKEFFEQQMVDRNISIAVWHDAVTDKPKKFQSIGQSHKNIVEFAKKRGMKQIAIAEDDIFFPANDGWEYFLKSIPTDFLIHVGGAYTYKLTINKYGFNTVKLHKWSGMHLYVVHQKFYNDFLAADTDNFNIEEAIRRKLEERSASASVCWPFAAVQAETPSDNILGKIYKISDYFNRYNVYGL